MVLAAGQGRRMLPFSMETPKPFLPLLGIPLIQFALDQILELDPKKTVVNFNHLSSTAVQKMKQLDYPNNSGLQESLEDVLLGGAGGLKLAQKYFNDGPVLVCNSDNLTDISFENLILKHRYLKNRLGVLATFALLPASPKGESYREVMANLNTGLIEGLGELKQNICFYSGVCVLEQEVFNYLPLGESGDFVEKIFMPLILKKQAGFYIKNAFWTDIGSPCLWWRTHLEVMSLLETGALHPRISKRIESKNIRLSDQSWCAKGLKSRSTQAPYSYASILVPKLHEYQVVYGDQGLLGEKPGIEYLGNYWLV